MRILVIVHRYIQGKGHWDLFRALEKRCELRTQFVDDGWPERLADLGDLAGVDAVLWFVRFREQARRPAFDWQGWGGLRLMYEPDASQNYHQTNTCRYLGQWPAVFRRHGYDLLICTGREVARRLTDDGVPALWVPKGFQPKRLFPLGGERAGLGNFGEPYLARRRMQDHLRRAGVPFTDFRCPFAELNEHLNRYLGILICNFEARCPLPLAGRIGARLYRWTPGPLFRLGPGIEPMAKNFEVAAAGCAPVCDAIDELEELGFRDGETMVSYRTFDELVEKARGYLASPDRLAAIGAAAGELAHARHTVEHRAEQMLAALATARA